MDINNAFPSKYLKTSDLGGQPRRVVMDRVEMELLGEDKRPVVYFKGKDKGLVLNKTNANTISDMWGSDTRTWEGKDIVIYPTRVDFKGERVDAIRVQYIDSKPSRPALQHSEVAPPAPLSQEMSDEIPW